MVVASPESLAPTPPREAGRQRAAAVAFERVAKSYGTIEVLRNISLLVPPGAFTVLYGPPASGKSILMRILMGLETPTAGRVFLRDQDVTAVASAERNIGYIPQSFALYPHYSVRENIAYPLKLSGVSERDAGPVVDHAAEMLRITDLLTKRPDQLSGGQKQRVAIARGLAKQTDIFLFDDPLAGLDFKLREQLVEDLRELQQEWRATFLYATSDAIEALTLADQLAVLDDGVIVEEGPPEEIYRNPSHQRSMALVGFPPANFLPGRIEAMADGAICRTQLFALPVRLSDGGDGSDVIVGIRPEAVVIEEDSQSAHEQPAKLRIEGRINLREDLGGEEIVYVDCGGFSLTLVDRHHRQRDDLDARVIVGISPGDVLVFDAASGSRLGHGIAGAATSATTRSNR